jgi:hypothetical protein
LKFREDVLSEEARKNAEKVDLTGQEEAAKEKAKRQPIVFPNHPLVPSFFRGQTFNPTDPMYGFAEKAAGNVANILLPKPKEAKEPKWQQGEDEDGNPILYDMVSGTVKPFPKGAVPKATGAEANRVASAKAALESSASIRDYLKDPKVRDEIGPLMGRYNSLLQAVGEGNPTAVKLVGKLKSYSALQPNIHGFRAVQFADQINDLLTTKQTPESLLAGIDGIDDAARAVKNRGKATPPGAAPGGQGAAASDPLGIR